MKGTAQQRAAPFLVFQEMSFSKSKYHTTVTISGNRRKTVNTADGMNSNVSGINSTLNH
jgi:hypothetical protein